MTIVLAAVVLFGLTLVFAGLLGVAKEKLKVEEDPRIAVVNEALPAANCGGCGFAGCSDFAKAVVEERAELTGCPVGGAKTAEAIAKALGVKVVKTAPLRPVLLCGAKNHQKLGRVPYTGVQSCVGADVLGATQGCVYGCLGYADCIGVCDYDAIHMVEGIPEIDYEKCIGCGACTKACPRNLLPKIPFKEDRMLVIACSNREPGKNVKQVCKVGCIGCSLCKRADESIFEVSNNLATINYDNYTTAADIKRKAIEKCPTDVMIYFGRTGPTYAKPLAKAEAEAEKARQEAEATADSK